jgi:hypothetical protein
MPSFTRTHLALIASGCLLCSALHAASDPLETVEVTGSRAQVRKQVEVFVSEVTRADGELIGRWHDRVCPLAVGMSDAQAQFVRQRLVEVQDRARKLKTDPTKACKPNLFVIVTDEPDQVLAQWKERDPGMFRWKTREGVSRYAGNGPVRVWHNATEQPSDGSPLTNAGADGMPQGIPRGKLIDSRIQASAAENIQAVVVLVDARGTHGMTLTQLSDYIAMVSLAKIDLNAQVVGIDTILQLFAEPRPANQPQALTQWDYAFLNGLYRTSYTPMHQRMDLRARMVRELAPR